MGEIYKNVIYNLKIGCCYFQQILRNEFVMCCVSPYGNSS